jgi:ubiquinone/menaquinone biosynthesis C-methylase UbiE
MLALAKKEADANKLSGRISFHEADVNCISDLFERLSFDVVVCHNLLEYMEDPLAVLRALVQVLKKDAKSVVSLLVRNRYGEVLKAAIKWQKQPFVQKPSSTRSTASRFGYSIPTRFRGWRSRPDWNCLPCAASGCCRIISTARL